MSKPPEKTPATIRARRLAAGLTQTEAAALVHGTLKTWQSWESTSGEARTMPLGKWELFVIKTKAAGKARV